MLIPLKHYLDEALKRSGAGRSVEAAVVVENARAIILQIVPELREADVDVVSYRKGTLTIAVASPAVGQELRLRSEPIVDVLNETFTGQPIERLRFVPRVDRDWHG